MRILLIDDDLLTLDMFHTALEMNGFECDKFDDPADAIVAFTSIHYDAVVCDFMMPVLSGADVLREIRKVSPDAIFIMYSAFPDTKLKEEAFRQGANDYLTKPINWGAFLELLEFYKVAV